MPTYTILLHLEAHTQTFLAEVRFHLLNNNHQPLHTCLTPSPQQEASRPPTEPRYPYNILKLHENIHPSKECAFERIHRISQLVPEASWSRPRTILAGYAVATTLPLVWPFSLKSYPRRCYPRIVVLGLNSRTADFRTKRVLDSRSERLNVDASRSWLVPVTYILYPPNLSSIDYKCYNRSSWLIITT
jgi:hypothetical protein